MTITSVNELNKKYGIPRDFIRKRIAEKRCPGFFSGKRFCIDQDAFLEMLKQECQENAGGT